MATGASTAETTLKPKKMEDVRFSQSPVTREATEKAHEMVDHAADHVAQAEAQIRSKSEQTRQSLSEKQDELSRNVDLYLDKSRTFMKEHPAASLGIAFGAGVLLARLMRRS